MIEIPDCMKSLPRDRRGYPVPVTALVERDGTPRYTITDAAKRQEMAREDRCHVTGRKLLRGRWFIGGPMAAFHEHGAFLDGPMLDEASLFAIQTCPFIAAPKYVKRIDDRAVSDETRAEIVVKMNEHAAPDRPPVFVRLMTVGSKLVGDVEGDVFVAKRPYRNVEFWCCGRRLGFEEGVAISVEDGRLTEDGIRRACGLSGGKRF